MNRLIKSDFKRILKDKLFFVLGILCSIFALITPLLYKVLSDTLPEGAGELIGSAASAKSMFFSAFSPVNNFGLIVPILLTVILYKDFSFGTIRNKIIGGKSRNSIFLSMFISSAVFLCIIMLIHGLLTLGIGLIFFDYQQTPFTSNDAVYLLESIGFEMLVFVFIASVTSFICVLSKNTGLAIVLSIAVNMALSLVSSILSAALMFIDKDNGDVLVKILKAVQNLNIYNFCTVIGFTEKYTAENILYLTLTPLVFSALLVIGGIFVFKKKDIK